MNFSSAFRQSEVFELATMFRSILIFMGSLCFIGRLPGGKSRKRFGGTGVITLASIQLGNLSHFILRQGEVQDIQIILDMGHVLASGNHDEAHLGMPAQDHLGGRFAVLVT